jgi:hypothetical protein
MNRFGGKRDRPQSLYLSGLEGDRHSLAERVGFAQILLDLRASFAPLNRVIKDYQRVFGT